MWGNTSHVSSLQQDYCLKESFVYSKMPLDFLEKQYLFRLVLSISTVLESCQLRWLLSPISFRNGHRERCSLSLLSFNGPILGPGTPAHHPHTSGLNHSLTRLFSVKLFCL